MNSTLSRRHFLGTLGAAAAAGRLPRGLAAEPAADNIRLGMMLQGRSAAELLEKAKHVAAVGFERVQVTFFFAPTADDLKTLAEALNELKLQTVAFGTYFNLFRPDDAGLHGVEPCGDEAVAAQAERFDCRQFVTWSASYARQFARGRSAKPYSRGRRAIAPRHSRGDPAGDRADRRPRGFRAVLSPRRRHVGLGEGGVAPFPAERIGMVPDPPNFISPALYPRREEQMRRLFRELGERIQMATSRT